LILEHRPNVSTGCASSVRIGKRTEAQILPVDHGEMRDFIAIARVLRPQGRKGEVLAEMLTDFPSRFVGLQRAFLEVSGGNPQALTVEHAWLHKGRVVLKFEGIASISEAETLRGRHVLVPEEEKVSLPAHQLPGGC